MKSPSPHRIVPLLLLATLWPAETLAQEVPAEESAQAVSGEEAADGWRLGHLLFDYEVGPLIILQNDGQYGEGGTAYTAEDVGQKDNLVLGQRFSIELEIVPRHTLVFLYAPLDVVTRATLEDDLRFRDTEFPAGTVVDHRYLFDGFRLSYLYGLVRRAVDFDLGASFQIRNANVAFTSVDGSLHAAEDDIGLVFAIKLRLRWDSPWALFALLDTDGIYNFGLGDVDGALYDVALTLGIPVADGLDLFFRSRGLGGGADVPDQYIDNWAHFLSFTAGVRLDLAALVR